MKNMRPNHNISKIMRNAWYLKKVHPATIFAACLRKAWRNEKIAFATARIENRPVDLPKAREYDPTASSSFTAGCLGYYANARPGQYFGD